MTGKAMVQNLSLYCECKQWIILLREARSSDTLPHKLKFRTRGCHTIFSYNRSLRLNHHAYLAFF